MSGTTVVVRQKSHEYKSDTKEALKNMFEHGYTCSPWKWLSGYKAVYCSHLRPIHSYFR